MTLRLLGKMTTFFNPQDAVPVHIELLPSNAHHVTARTRHIKLPQASHLGEKSWLEITAWYSREQRMSCVSGGGEEDFIENTCSECQWYVEEVEIDLNYMDVEIMLNDEYIYLHGTAYGRTPCPAYNDGLGEVEFPCIQGHNGPEGEVDDYNTIDCRYLVMGNMFDPVTYEKRYDWAKQQGVADSPLTGTTYLTDEYRTINAFDNAIPRICWGSADDPVDLALMTLTYTQSNANEDLLDFESHNDWAEEISDYISGFNDAYESPNDDEDPADDHTLTPAPDVMPVSYQGRQMGLVAATADTPASYVYLVSAGCKTTAGSAVFQPVSLYRKVTLSDDLVLDVWVTDVLPTNTRLVFVETEPMPPSQNKPAKYALVGQIPHDFPLQPCESNNVPSSAAEVQDKPLSPA